MDNNIDNIDDLFREGFADYAETPPPAVWQALERRLDNDKKRRVFPLRWFWYIGMLIVAVVLGAGILYMSESGKEAANKTIAEDMPVKQQLSNETVAVNTTSPQRAAHTMPAKKDDMNVMNNVNNTAIQADEKGTVSAPKQKLHERAQKRATKRENSNEQMNTTDAEKTKQNTTQNAPATGTSMYGYDDNEQMITDVEKEPAYEANRQIAAGYVVSKKRKHKMVVVEMLPEAIAAAESNNADNNGSAINLKGKGVQIAKASAGMGVDEITHQQKGVYVAGIAATTAPNIPQDTEKEVAVNEGMENATGKENSNEQRSIIAKATTHNGKPKKLKQALNGTKTKVEEQSTVLVQEQSSSKSGMRAESITNEKKQVVPVATARVSTNSGEIAKVLRQATPKAAVVKNVIPTEKDGVAKTISATAKEKRSAAKITAVENTSTHTSIAATAKEKSTTTETTEANKYGVRNSVAATVKEKSNQTKTTEVKNTSAKNSVARSVETSADKAERVSSKQKERQDKNVADVKNSRLQVAAEQKATAVKNAAKSNDRRSMQSLNSENKEAVTDNKVEVDNTKLAAQKNAKEVVTNSEVTMKSNDTKAAARKGAAYLNVTNNEPKKIVMTGSAVVEKGGEKRVIKKQLNTALQNDNNGTRKRDRQKPKLTESSTTETASKATGSADPSAMIASKTGTTNAVINAHKQQNRNAKSKSVGTNSTNVNVVSPATTGNNMGGKKRGILALNSLLQAGGKWSFNSSLPEETTADDYVVKKEFIPLGHSSDKVVETLNKKIDTTTVIKDSVETNVADSARKDTSVYNSRWVMGVKAGVETGMMSGGANKAVVSPYLHYKFSERLSLMVQPALKVAGMSTRNVGNASNYYEVNPGTGSYKLTDSALLILVLTGDTLWSRNYTYTERYDSVVKTNKTGGNYMEIELPMLLQYKVTKRLSIYGGINTVYGKKMGVTEHTYTAKAMPRYGYVNTLASYYAPAPVPTGTGITYTGNPLSGYTGPQYPTENGEMFRFGYMFGVSYEVRKRWLADVLVQQCITQQNLVAGYNVNKPLSVPYFRFTLGYRLSK